MPRRRVSSGSPYEKEYGFSRVVAVNDRILVAGTAPVWEDGEVDPDPGAQAVRCLEIILTALAQVGAAPEHVVRTRMYVTDRSYAEVVGRVHGKVFGDVRPVSTLVVVAGLIDPRWKVEIEAEVMLEPRRNRWRNLTG